MDPEESMSGPGSIVSHHFHDDGGTPNHPVLPVMVMQGTPAANTTEPAEWFERRFHQNGWGATWRWTVYPYQHYHSTNHEVLGVSCGNATILLGGEEGVEVRVGIGDVIVLPAGTGHKRVSSSGDFQVVGGYPGGCEPDLLRPGEGDPREIRRQIAAVPVPESDPVYGSEGPLLPYWKA